jgi:hypothetical protein
MPVYKTDSDNRRFLEFNGKNYVMLQGGTAFPYASTYELSIRPDKLGEVQNILEAPNGQITIRLLKDGRVKVMRRQAIEGEGGRKSKRFQNVSITSKKLLTKGKWVNLAIVYDLRNLILYINGEKEAEVPTKFNRDHEKVNIVVLGGGCKFPCIPVPEFKGGIRNVRIYGRNLKPNEFLKNK